jgi:hypothetical protein
MILSEDIDPLNSLRDNLLKHTVIRKIIFTFHNKKSFTVYRAIFPGIGMWEFTAEVKCPPSFVVLVFVKLAVLDMCT